MAAQLALNYDPATTHKDLFTVPWPSREIGFAPRTKKVKHDCHECGLGRFGSHYWPCVDPGKCRMEPKSPCPACQDRVQASYRAGRYCSR